MPTSCGTTKSKGMSSAFAFSFFLFQNNASFMSSGHCAASCRYSASQGLCLDFMFVWHSGIYSFPYLHTLHIFPTCGIKKVFLILLSFAKAQSCCILGCQNSGSRTGPSFTPINRIMGNVNGCIRTVYQNVSNMCCDTFKKDFFIY